jgi:uncharacterized repeat protein (TIGR01451 family)
MREFSRRNRLRVLLTLTCLAVAAGWPGGALAGQASVLPSLEATELPATAVQAITDSMQGTGGDQPAVIIRDGKVPVFVELAGTPTGLVWAATLKELAGRGNAAVSAARSAVAAQAAINTSQQQAVGSILQSRFAGDELFRAHKALNGIAVYVDPASVGEIRRLPGVKSVQVMFAQYPTNSTSVPFIGAPQLWNNEVGIGRNVTGAGIKVGVIDSGIDYIHSNFGGPGTLAAYQDALANPQNHFPTAKVVGGWDFVGDGYPAGPAVQDPYPLDCGGHGSHVAGTIAGLGVNADGTTYTGGYSSAAPFASLRIGPGVAPEASLYALRVFGCGGSTNYVVPAIEWAMSPDGDDDFSDHLDVINMSLGSNYGDGTDSTAQAAEAAAEVGILVACSAGNGNDTYYILGGPSAATRAVSTAASVDPGGLWADKVHVNTPTPTDYAAYAATYTIPFSPGVTGNVIRANDGTGTLDDGCENTATWPGVSGNIALIQRGTCTFLVKVKNAIANGAIGVIVYNNPANGNTLSYMALDPTVTIPALHIGNADGLAIIAALPVNATLISTPTAGAGDTLASFSSRGPRPSSPITAKPDITAPGYNITSTQTGRVCWNSTTQTSCFAYAGTDSNSALLPGNYSAIASGTSMAAPHVAGALALLKQIHPDWSAEEIKALAMNTSLHDLYTGLGSTGSRYGASRVGDGRLDTVGAATDGVVAFNADDSGSVSVSFGTEVVGSTTMTKQIRVVNHTAVAQSYTLALDTVVDAPGVAFSLPGGSQLSVPANSSTTFDVQMSVPSANALKHSLEASVSPLQDSTARHWLTEETAYVTLSQGAAVKLRVPVHTAPVAASTMAAPATLPTGSPVPATGSGTITVAGTDVCTGTYTPGPPATCTATLPNDELSLVSPFELQVMSPPNPASASFADIQYAGVSLTSTYAYFGVSTWDDWASPNQVAFNIYVDCGAYNTGTATCDSPGVPDGTWDFVMVTYSYGQAVGTGVSDAFYSRVANLHTMTYGGNIWRLNGAAPNIADTRAFNNNVAFMYATRAALGIQAAGTFRYGIRTCPQWSTYCANSYYDAADGPYSFTPSAPGLDFGGVTNYFDLNGVTIPFTWNVANMTANGSLGALLLHMHNAKGQRAQVLTLPGVTGADLEITNFSIAPGLPAVGQNGVITTTVRNNGPSAATGVVVNYLQGSGFEYVSDNGGGAFNPNQGLWTVGAMASGASATLQITVTRVTSDPISAAAEVGGTSPLDSNLANNKAALAILAPAQADVWIAKRVTPANPPPGTYVTFTVEVSNAGPDPAYNVVVTDLLSSFYTYSSSTTTSGSTYDPVTGRWTLASLGANTTETLTIVALPNGPGHHTNTATVTSTTADLTQTNNTVVFGFDITPTIPLLSYQGLTLFILLMGVFGALVLRRLTGN